MPWQSNADLPAPVRSALPVTAQSVFKAAANEQLLFGASEEQAISVAWDVVKDTWQRGEDGLWVSKLGARNSRSDFGRIQSIHDSSVLLGAVCEGHGVEKRARSLFLSRPLVNYTDFIAWAKSQGFETTLQPGDLHVTIAYSKEPLEWPSRSDLDSITANIKEGREVVPLGDGGAVVLKFKSPHLNARWDEVRRMGASWSHPQYMPHITISWQASDVNLADVAPYKGDLIFGPEKFAEVNEDWQENVTEKVMAQVVKVDDELGIVFGWAIISKIRGKDYWDVQEDHIPEQAMLKASVGYMQRSRIGGNMHRYQGSDAMSVERVGEVVFAYPLTTEIKAAMGIKCDISGLAIGMKVHRADILEKFKNGTYTGFSIGGNRLVDKEVVDG